jgi:hypothetical protein
MEPVSGSDPNSRPDRKISDLTSDISTEGLPSFSGSGQNWNFAASWIERGPDPTEEIEAAVHLAGAETALEKLG